MNKIICGLLVLFLFSCGRTTLAIKNKVIVGNDGDLIGVLELKNLSNDSIFLPANLVLTPDEGQTLHGVFSIRKKTSLFKAENVKNKDFDYSIPHWYFFEELSPDSSRIGLSPKSTQQYEYEFFSYYPVLSKGKYCLTVCLTNTFDRFYLRNKCFTSKFVIINVRFAATSPFLNEVRNNY